LLFVVAVGVKVIGVFDLLLLMVKMMMMMMKVVE
jgi:hypothetical protein